MNNIYSDIRLSKNKKYLTSKLNAGFTLLEIMVAVAILGVGLVVIFQLFSVSLNLQNIVKDYTEAFIHSQNKIIMVLLMDKVKPIKEAGKIDDKYSYYLEVTPTKDKKIFKVNSKVFWWYGENKKYFEISSYKSESASIVGE